jgi:hypothetical protein
MKKQYGIVFLVALYANTGGANENSEKDKIVIAKKEVNKKTENSSKKAGNNSLSISSKY